MRRASKTRMAFRRFPPESSMISFDTSGGRSNFFFFAMCSSTVSIYQHRRQFNKLPSIPQVIRTSSGAGAATRMRRQRLLIGAMSRLVLLAQRMIRMLDMYFSIVRRRAACASRDRESASLMMTTGCELQGVSGRERGGMTYEGRG